MLHFNSLFEAENVLKALSAPLRLQIMEMIYIEDSLSINDLAKLLDVTPGAVSVQVSNLEEAGLVRVIPLPAKHGVKKMVQPKHDRLVIDMAQKKPKDKCYWDEVRVGHYCEYQVFGKCGIATIEKMVGENNDPRCFSFADRFNGEMIWSEKGYFEYLLPNHLLPGQVISQLTISFEISSVLENEIKFYLNDSYIGEWICKDEFGGRSGYLSPNWWPQLLPQYGVVKEIIINNEGTFLEQDKQISNITLDTLGIDYSSKLKFRLESQNEFAIFGEKYGDHPQGIKIQIRYE